MQAEEVLQAAYLKILEGTAHYRGEAAFKTWLFGLIRHTASEQRRRRLLHRLRLKENASVLGPSGATVDPADQAHRTRVLARFRQALPSLPRRQRQVMQLVFGNDLTIEEAATILGVSIGSARTHYERGKQRLRALLAELEVTDAAGE